MAVEIARAHGWAAETEASGTTPSGELWRADVLAHNGKHRVAVEIQWSAQTLEEIMRRQARYAASGVRCLWLMRRREIPVDRALPAARIGGDAETGYTATLKTVTGQQVLPMKELLAGAFSKRLRFGIPVGTSGQVQIFVRALHCWSCRAKTQIISHVCVVVGPNTFRFAVPDFDDHLALVDFIGRRLPNDLQIGSVKHRFTSVRRLAYLSNGCFHCDARFEHSYGSGAKVCEFSIEIDTQWLEIIGERHGWGVYPSSSSGQFSQESRI